MRGENIVAIANGGIFITIILVWPIFLIYLSFDYQELGMITSAVTFLAIFITMTVSRIDDKYNKKKLVKIGARINMITWILRSGVTGIFGAFGADALNTIGASIKGIPMKAVINERAKDKGIVESIMIRHIIGATTKLLYTILLFSLVYFAGVEYIFVMFLVMPFFEFMYFKL